jgi:hypothetical protein
VPPSSTRLSASAMTPWTCGPEGRSIQSDVGVELKGVSLS